MLLLLPVAAANNMPTFLFDQPAWACLAMAWLQQLGLLVMFLSCDGQHVGWRAQTSF